MFYFQRFKVEKSPPSSSSFESTPVYSDTVVFFKPVICRKYTLTSLQKRIQLLRMLIHFSSSDAQCELQQHILTTPSFPANVQVWSG